LPSTLFLSTDTAPTEIYTLSLHDALPIFPLQQRDEGNDLHVALLRQIICGLMQYMDEGGVGSVVVKIFPPMRHQHRQHAAFNGRSEEHTSELQSPCNLVCRLLLEKKKKNI